MKTPEEIAEQIIAQAQAKEVFRSEFSRQMAKALEDMIRTAAIRAIEFDRAQHQNLGG